MLSLYVIANILFIGFASASLANLYDDCLQEGMLFERFGKWLKTGNTFVKKPLGGCLICTNVWVTVLVALVYITVPMLFMLLALIGISNTILKFIIK